MWSVYTILKRGRGGDQQSYLKISPPDKIHCLDPRAMHIVHVIVQGVRVGEDSSASEKNNDG